MLIEGLYALLVGAPEIQALLSTPLLRTDGTPGIFGGVIQENCDLPAIVYLQVYGQEAATFDGRGKLRSSRFQFSSYGVKYGDAKQTAAAVKDVLLGYQGTLTEGTQVDSITLVSEVDSFVKAPLPAQESGGRSLFHSAVDVEVWFREP